MTPSIRKSASRESDMMTIASLTDHLGHPSVISWTLTCISAILSYVFKNLYCKYREILKEMDFLKIELLKTSNEIKILSAKMDSSIDNLRTIISYIERDLHK